MEDFMLEDYYVKPSTVDRVRASWLAPQIENYLEWLESHRYSRLVVYRRLPLLFHFAEFAQKKGCKDVASCEAYIKDFVLQVANGITRSWFAGKDCALPFSEQNESAPRETRARRVVLAVTSPGA
jgi:hypothetical protein